MFHWNILKNHNCLHWAYLIALSCTESFVVSTLTHLSLCNKAFKTHIYWMIDLNQLRRLRTELHWDQPWRSSLAQVWFLIVHFWAKFPVWEWNPEKYTKQNNEGVKVCVLVFKYQIILNIINPRPVVTHINATGVRIGIFYMKIKKKYKMTLW